MLIDLQLLGDQLHSRSIPRLVFVVCFVVSLISIIATTIALVFIHKRHRRQMTETRQATSRWASDAGWPRI